MAFVETPSGRLHYQVCDVATPWSGEPQTILFHHGVAASLHIWHAWIPVLASRYRLVTFDMRGYGESVVPPRDFDWTFDVLIDDALRVADAVGAQQFHMVGESIGGTAALALALRAPQRVRGLVLSNSAARGGLISNVASWRETVAQQGQAAWAKEMMQRRFHPGALEERVHAWYLHLHESCSIDACLGLADLLLHADLTARLSEVQMPTLLLSPDASPFIPLDVMVAMRKQMPRAELQVFAHAKHGLPLSHGQTCAQVTAAFLQRHFG